MINSNGSTTWDSSTPIEDIWEKANDPCPQGWRVPTNEEWENFRNSVYIAVGFSQRTGKWE